MASKKREAPRSSSVAAARGQAGGRAAKRPVSGGWRDNVKSLLGAVLIFLFVRTLLVEAFRIPSGSMIPTLLVGDWLFVNKLVYGPNIPFTGVNLPGYSEPRRGEVAVFRSPPQDPMIRISPGEITPTLVKRLVAVPGDTAYMRGGLLHINGIAQRQGHGTAPDQPGYQDLTSPLFDWQQQYALSGTRFGSAPAEPTVDDWGPLLIPTRRYMMLGDNRYNSVDSRHYGLVPRENFRGRPLFIYYSWDAGSERPLPALTEIRWGRIGHRIR